VSSNPPWTIISRINAFVLTLNLIPVNQPMMSLTIPVYLMADNDSRLIRESPNVRNVNNYAINFANPDPFHLMLHTLPGRKGGSGYRCSSIHICLSTMLNMLTLIWILLCLPATGEPIPSSRGRNFQKKGNNEPTDRGNYAFTDSGDNLSANMVGNLPNPPLLQRLECLY
jgi:hypothetical protein